MDNFGFVLADLNTKLTFVEEEKASLVTAIRLLQYGIILQQTNSSH